MSSVAEYPLNKGITKTSTQIATTKKNSTQPTVDSNAVGTGSNMQIMTLTLLLPHHLRRFEEHYETHFSVVFYNIEHSSFDTFLRQ